MERGDADLADQLDVADIDAQLQRGGGHQHLQFAALEALLGVEAQLLGQAAVVRGHRLLAEPVGEMARDPLGHAPRVDEHQGGAVRAGQFGEAVVDPRSQTSLAITASSGTGGTSMREVALAGVADVDDRAGARVEGLRERWRGQAWRCRCRVGGCRVRRSCAARGGRRGSGGPGRAGGGVFRASGASCARAASAGPPPAEPFAAPASTPTRKRATFSIGFCVADSPMRSSGAARTARRAAPATAPDGCRACCRPAHGSRRRSRCAPSPASAGPTPSRAARTAIRAWSPGCAAGACAARPRSAWVVSPVRTAVRISGTGRPRRASSSRMPASGSSRLMRMSLDSALSGET